MAACSYESDGFNVVAVHVAKILSTIAAAFKPRRAPARLPTSLACRLAAGWRIERVLISPRWRQSIDSPYGDSVPLDYDDPALVGTSDQDESPISAPVVWLVLRRAELDCYPRYCPLIGRVAAAENPGPEERGQCQSLTSMRTIGSEEFAPVHEISFFVRPENSFLTSKAISVVRPNRLPGVRFAQTNAPKRCWKRAGKQCWLEPRLWSKDQA